MKTLTEFSGVILRQAAAVRDAKIATGLEGDALTESVAGEMSIAGDRAARLLEALEVAGGKLDAIRTVRVYQGEAAPPQARTIGEFHYVVERLGSAVPGARDRDDRRGRGGPGRGGPGRGRPGGGPGGRPGGGPGGGAGRGPGGGPGRGSGGGRGDSDGRRERGDKEVPSGGEGWALTRAPREGGDRRDRDRDRGRKPRRGRPDGDRKDRRPGDRPPGNRTGPRPAPTGNGPGRPQPSGDRQGESRRPRGPRKPRRGESQPEVSIRPRPARRDGEQAPAEPPQVAQSEAISASSPVTPEASPAAAVASVVEDDRTTASPDGHVQRRKRRPRKRGRGPRSEQQGAENTAPPPPSEVNGNFAPPAGDEPNGNVIDGPEDIDDSFGNR